MTPSVILTHAINTFYQHILVTQSINTDSLYAAFDDLRCLLRINIHIPENIIPSPSTSKTEDMNGMNGLAFVESASMSSSSHRQQSNWNSLYSPHTTSQHHMYGSNRSDQSDVASVSNRSDDTSFSTHPSVPSSMGGSAYGGGGNGSNGGRNVTSRPVSLLRRNVLAGFDSASDLGMIICCLLSIY